MTEIALNTHFRFAIAEQKWMCKVTILIRIHFDKCQKVLEYSHWF